MGSNGSAPDQLSKLRSEVGYLEKIVATLIGRAETASDIACRLEGDKSER